MRLETQVQTVDIFTESIGADGTPEYTATGETEEITITDIYADNGKIVRMVGDIGGCKHITIGSAYSVNDFEEVEDESED